MCKFKNIFNKILKEDITASDALGGSEGLYGGSVGNEDTYAPGDQRIPKSIFGGIITRAGSTKKKKKKKKKEDEEEELKENYADGKKKGKSRPGRVKRSGASCKGTVTELRKRAKKYGGEKGKMYHWCANMKSGKKKSESEEEQA